ncbi:MAG: hypothetical protein H0X42_10465 [Solirubrobacterales bacterium]|nr:hypothetical protein [Solirubrobacterales bacterium]
MLRNRICVPHNASENDDSYVGATKAALEAIEPTLSAATFSSSPTVKSTSYKIVMRGSSSTQKFWVERTSAGVLKFECEKAGTGGCPKNGSSTKASWAT